MFHIDEMFTRHVSQFDTCPSVDPLFRASATPHELRYETHFGHFCCFHMRPDGNPMFSTQIIMINTVTTDVKTILNGFEIYKLRSV